MPINFANAEHDFANSWKKLTMKKERRWSLAAEKNFPPRFLSELWGGGWPDAAQGIWMFSPAMADITAFGLSVNFGGTEKEQHQTFSESIKKHIHVDTEHVGYDEEPTMQTAKVHRVLTIITRNSISNVMRNANNCAQRKARFTSFSKSRFEAVTKSSKSCQLRIYDTFDKFDANLLTSRLLRPREFGNSLNMCIYEKSTLTHWQTLIRWIGMKPIFIKFSTGMIIKSFATLFRS